MTGDQGGAGDAAMYTRWRLPEGREAAPCLAFRCELCEAQGCNEVWKRMHIDYVHGGLQRYRNAVTVIRCYSGPHVPDAIAKRASIQAARQCQEFATSMPETVLTNDDASWWEQLQNNVFAGANDLWHVLQQHASAAHGCPLDPFLSLKPHAQYSIFRHPSAHKPRRFEACVFCALQF